MIKNEKTEKKEIDLMKRPIVYCGNCGKTGHTYKRCLSPIISLGIVLFKIVNNELNYLFVQRRDTLGFVEFMRGKYNLDNIDYISDLIKIMTYEERNLILNNSFDFLWNKLWLNLNNKKFHNEYSSSKQKFYRLKNGFYVNRRYYNYDILNKTVPYTYNETEWGFPKGRRNMRENDIDCAKREFQEETGFNEDDYELLNETTYFNELFCGTNNIRYQHTYYLGKALKDTNLKIDKNNFNQYSEIKNVKWFTYNKGIKIIRGYNVEKKQIFKQINDHLKELLKNKLI